MAPSEFEPRIAGELPSGETIRSLFMPDFTGYTTSRAPYAPGRHRTEVFAGLSMPGDGWGKFLAGIGQLIMPGPSNTVEGCSDVDKREKYSKKRHVFWGGWDSHAGSMLSALYPKSRTGVVTILAVTSDRLRVVYVQRRRGSATKYGDATQLGWSCPLSEVAWIREHPAMGDSFEFGFTDRSWGVLLFNMAGEGKTLRETFPEILSTKTPMPL